MTPAEIERLRAAVGWNRDGRYAAILRGSYTHYNVRAGGRLVGFLNVISDGVADALLVDLVIHPAHQRRGLGTRLVRRAVRDLSHDGIQCIQVTFTPAFARFYRGAGFEVIGGGIVDNRARAK